MILILPSRSRIVIAGSVCDSTSTLPCSSATITVAPCPTAMCTSGFSICACAAAAMLRTIHAHKSCFIGSSLNSAPVEQRLRDRAGVDVLELAAERHAACDAAHLHVPRAQHLGDVMRRGFAFIGEVGGEDHFAHLGLGRALEQPV